jgi:Sec-independent protein translocase protein TatA
MGKDIGQVTVRFRDAFGDHKEEYDEEDYDDDDGGGGD